MKAWRGMHAKFTGRYRCCEARATIHMVRDEICFSSRQRTGVVETLSATSKNAIGKKRWGEGWEEKEEKEKNLGRVVGRGIV